MLKIPHKEAIREEVGRLLGTLDEELNATMQRNIDFWFVTFETEFLTRRCSEHIAKIVVESHQLIQALE